MRNRSRSDDREQAPQDKREASRGAPRDASVRDRDRDEGDDDKRRGVRIPKIQYRFLKELEERGVSENARAGALGMADKIRRYPLDERAVMGSWERFTKKAIEDFKKTGPSPERDRQHLAYAILFSTLRDKPAAQNAEELMKRVQAYETPAPRREKRQAEDRRSESPPHAGSASVPEQRELIQRERPRVDEQLDTTLDRLRELPSPLRATIEASARDMIVEGHHTWRSAREAFPDAIKELRADRSEKNTVHAFTLALIAKSASHGELRAELDSMRDVDHKPIADEARARLERYPPLETGIADVRRDAAAAGVKYALHATPAVRREALVLAEAREQIESLADPKRLQWDGIGEDLAERLA